MLFKVEVRNSQGALLAFPLDDVSTGIYIQEINGLDPVKATVVSSSFAQMDGSEFESSRRDERNITMKLGLEPDYTSMTPRGLRKILYQYFMPKSSVELRFYDTDGLIVNANGLVESCEISFFTDEPEVDISVICFDPDFLDLTSVTLSGNTTNSTTDPAGNILISYDGEVGTGIVAVLHVDRSLSEFTIYHQPPDNILRTMDFSYSLVAGDVLTISTVAGDKGVTLTRSSTDSSVLYGLSPQSTWIELQPGDNYIRPYAVGAAIPIDISYTTRYGGL